jgi:hypothetical protein
MSTLYRVTAALLHIMSAFVRKSHITFHPRGNHKGKTCNMKRMRLIRTYVHYVCVYVYMYVCVSVCMYVCMYICVYVSMYVCVCMYYFRTYVCMYVSLCVRVCMYMCIMYVCMYVYM